MMTYNITSTTIHDNDVPGRNRSLRETQRRYDQTYICRERDAGKIAVGVDLWSRLLLRVCRRPTLLLINHPEGKPDNPATDGTTHEIITPERRAHAVD